MSEEKLTDISDQLYEINETLCLLMFMIAELNGKQLTIHGNSNGYTLKEVKDGKD
jgi:hypothetical protein